MFRKLRTSTKLLVLCGAFSIAIGVPVYGFIAEKWIAIAFARKELVGTRYLAAVREICAAVLAAQAGQASGERSRAALQALVEAESTLGGALQTAGLAQSVAVALRELGAAASEDGRPGARVQDALWKVQALAVRVGDDSNLALDPDLDTYYVQGIAVRKLPTLLGRLSELQEAFASGIEAGLPSQARAANYSSLASLLRSVADEVKRDIEASYRGNADGRLKQTVASRIGAMLSSLESYLGVLSVSRLGLDARDAVTYSRLHEDAVRQTLETWAVLQAELDRLLQRRIDGLLGRMGVGLALIAAFAGVSVLVAVLTHRHIVRPLERLEAVASAVRATRDYSLRADYSGQDEIGRVTAAFNDMLSELATSRLREDAERSELARITRLTSMGEMAASIAHEVNNPLAAIVASGNAGLRWLANPTPDLDEVEVALRRIVRDGMRASEIVGGIRAMFKKEVQERAPLRVGDLVEDVVALMHSELQSERIAVRLEPGGQVPHVLASRVQLQQVLLNLITNAIDAMRTVRDRPRLLRIAIVASVPDGVVVTVEDSGAGIDPDVKDRVFDAFYTTKSSGMGLGLAICRSIIEAHEGQVSVSTRHPHGSIFRFALPAWNPEA